MLSPVDTWDKPYQFMGNFPFPEADRHAADIDALHLQRLMNPAKRYGPMLEAEAYWESFHVRPEFYSLVNSHLLPPDNFRMFQHHYDVAVPLILGMEEVFRLVLPMLIRIEVPAARHIDTPVRDFACNWYPFETHGHTIHFDGGHTIVPKRGDMYIFDVDKWHWTEHLSKAIVYMMSLSLRRK